MAAGKFSVVCVTHFYFIGQQWSRACVQTRLPTGAIKANEQRRFAGVGSEWRKEPRAPFQGQLLLPPADHYHSVKEVVQPEFLSSLTEAKIIQIFVWHLQNLAFLANSSFFFRSNKIYLWAEFSYQLELLTQRVHVWLCLCLPSARRMLPDYSGYW